MTNNEPYYRHPRTEMAALLPARYTRVLEIGCGEGAFRREVTAPCEYWGIEPVATAAAVASGRLDRVLVGTYQDVAAQLPEHGFDLIICNDVIEHMADHEAFFAGIQRHLAPDGRLVGSIPNVRYLRNLRDLLIHKDWHYRESGILDATHLRFFTRKSLRRTLLTHGYEIEVLQGIGPLRLFSASPRAWGRLLMVCLLGWDTRYRQFAFRVRRAAGATRASSPKSTARSEQSPPLQDIERPASDLEGRPPCRPRIKCPPLRLEPPPCFA